jgi:hypothetical protein
VLGVTPILKNGRAEIQLRNGGKSTIVVNILIWSEGHQRPAIRQLLSEQLSCLPPKTATPVDITKAVLAMTHGGGNLAVWILFEVDPDCQRFRVRYELDIYDGLITRFVEQYLVH